MAIAYITSAKAGSANGTTAVTVGVDTTGANLLVALGVADASKPSSITDSKGNTWVGLTERAYAGFGHLTRLFYCLNPTVGTGHTFTNTVSSAANLSIAVAAYSGVKTTTAFDAENGASANGTSVATGNVTPTENGELIITGTGVYTSPNAPTVDAGFTLRQSAAYVTNSLAIGLADKIQTTAAATGATWSTTSSEYFTSAIATFKAAPAAGDTTAPTVTSFTATAASSSQINIAYAATDNVGVTGWDLDFSTDNATWTALLANSTVASPYAHTGRTASTLYYYRFRARDAAGNVSAYATSNATTSAASGDTTPPTITSISVDAVSSSQINLSYAATDNVGVTGWDIDWSPNGTTGWTVLLANSAAASPYAHTALTASTTYHYRFRARDAAGNVSGYLTATATTQAGGGGADTTTPTVTSFTATTNSSSQITLAYAANDNVGVTGWDLDFSLNNVNWTVIFGNTLTASPYAHAGLATATLYYYRFRARL